MRQERTSLFRGVFYGWVVVGAAIVVGFLTTGLIGYANGIFLPHYADALANGSRGQVSIGFSITSIVAAMVAPFAGRYADNHSPRKVMLVGALLILFGYLGISVSQSLWHFYIAMGVLFGLGITLAGPNIRSLIVSLWFERWRGRALGLSVLGASLAGVALPVVLSDFVNDHGWRTSVLVCAASVACILIPTIVFTIKDQPSDVGEVRDGRKNALPPDALKASDRVDDQKSMTWKEMLQNKSFWAIGLIFGPMTCVYIAISIHLFGHATNSGLQSGQAALVLSAMALVSVMGKPFMGLVADHVGARITIWLSLLLQCAGLVCFTLSAELWQFVFAAGLHGLGYSAMSAMRAFALSISLGTKSLGSSMGLLKWIELPFAASASPIAGFVYDATGSYNFAFLSFAGLLILACLGPFFIRDGRISSPTK